MLPLQLYLHVREFVIRSRAAVSTVDMYREPVLKAYVMRRRERRTASRHMTRVRYGAVCLAATHTGTGSISRCKYLIIVVPVACVLV